MPRRQDSVVAPRQVELGKDTPHTPSWIQQILDVPFIFALAMTCALVATELLCRLSQRTRMTHTPVYQSREWGGATC